ncbi:MAG: glyoxalase [Bacteroidia bacterium]|nr:glyoxalase [Bacteroidia bacterium]
MHFKEIRLYSSHLQELFYFYYETLGLDCLVTENELQIRMRDTLLRFEKSTSNDNSYYHFAFNIPSNKIDEAYLWLKERLKLLWIEDHKSYIADFKTWNAKSLYFIDPGGNIVEFIGRFDLADVSETTFSASLIRNVSEIGLVFPEASFDNKIDKLLSSWDLSYFKKQPPLPDFRAIGDDNGLFICVPENRSWYPLKNKPALTFPLKVILNAGKGEFLLEL